MASPDPRFAALAAQLNEDPQWISIVTNTRVGQQQRDAMMQQYATQHGFQLPKGYHFDAGGSASFVPDRHPLRDGLTVGSLLLGGGALAGGLLAPSAAVAAPSATAATAPTVLTGAGALPVSALPTISGPAAAAGTAAKGGFSIAHLLGLGGSGGGFSVGDIVKSALGPGLNTLTGLITSHNQNKIASETLAAQTQAEKYAADLQSKSAAEQLAFLKEQEATRKAEFDKTQALNLDQYTQGQNRLAPYRNMGQSALAWLGRPIGTVGSILGV